MGNDSFILTGSDFVEAKEHRRRAAEDVEDTPVRKLSIELGEKERTTEGRGREIGRRRFVMGGVLRMLSEEM